MLSWLPEEASNLAGKVDNVLLVVTVVSVFFFLLISVFLVYYALKYRRRSEDDHTPYITGNIVIEVIWTVVPSILLMVFFAWGYIEFVHMKTPPQDATEVNVTARQWMWEFEYYDGKKTINELYVQKDRPVRMVMQSEDVIHSFFVPAFRVKQDVLPGRYTQLWFTPTKAGDFDLFCAEYCGTGHSQMRATVHVLSPEAFSRWMNKGKGGTEEAQAAELSPQERGKKVYQEKGCSACHSVDGSPIVGPTFKGLFGHKVELESGETITADENYIRHSILEPQAQIVKGYQPVMPSFKGKLTDKEITGVIEYIKSLK